MESSPKIELSVVVPVYNEEARLPITLERLARQLDGSGDPLRHSLYRIIVVDNNSTDGTGRVVTQFQKCRDVPQCVLVHERIKGMVSVRSAGVNYVLDPNNRSLTDYLAFCDADVDVKSNWIASILHHFEAADADVLSYAGTFPLSFWKQVPQLTQRYLQNVGTIFFDPPTVDWLGVRGQEFIFTEQVFHDFVRPVSGGCYAIRREAYLKAGGYQREYLDDDKKREVDGPSWRLIFRLERMGARIVYVNDSYFNCSPRRLLEEPEAVLGSTSYEGLNTMQDYRNVAQDKYARLESLAKTIDFTPVQRYVIQYYMLMRCITRLGLVVKNEHYFGDLRRDLGGRIEQWWQDNPKPQGKDIFAFSAQLSDEFFERILSSLPHQVA